MDKISPSTTTTPPLEHTTSLAPVSLREVIRANPTATPGCEKAKQITVTAGLKCLEESENSGPIGLLTKMLLGQSATWSSTKRFLIWSQSATPAGRTLYRLSPVEPITGEIEYGLLPTPMYKDGYSWYILTRTSSLKRVHKQFHWGHKAILFYNLKKGRANPRFSLYLMGYPTKLLDLDSWVTQLSIKFR